MKKLLFLGVLFFANAASADIIVCRFTEPFLNMTYSMAQQSLTIQGADIPRRVIRNVAFQILGRGHFIIGNVNNPRIRLRLTYRGSDGASDFIYPYSGERPNVFGQGRSQFGGCESNYLRRRAGN